MSGGEALRHLQAGDEPLTLSLHPPTSFSPPRRIVVEVCSGCGVLVGCFDCACRCDVSWYAMSNRERIARTPRLIRRAYVLESSVKRGGR